MRLYFIIQSRILCCGIEAETLVAYRNLFAIQVYSPKGILEQEFYALYDAWNFSGFEFLIELLLFVLDII